MARDLEGVFMVVFNFLALGVMMIKIEKNGLALGMTIMRAGGGCNGRSNEPIWEIYSFL